MEISKQSLFPYLLYNQPIPYHPHITVHPVTMKDIVLFQTLSKSITLRKNSIFHYKKIIKMTYLDFLHHSLGNKELEASYEIPGLSQYLFYSIQLLQLCCKDAEIKIHEQTKEFCINHEWITPQIFDDLRRIIIIQNDISFDMDAFLHYDTEQRLIKAENAQSRGRDKGNLEDYIDSLVIAMNTTEERISHMTIRKFWRYMKRYQLHEHYKIAKTGECSGMVSFKEPIKYWMTSLEEEDKYKHLKTDENELRGKVH